MAMYSTYTSNTPVYHCVVSVQHDVHIIAGVYKSQVRGCPGDYSLYGGTQYLWAVSTELPSCHTSGAQNFVVALRCPCPRHEDI